jgi:hypothetical protein
VDPHAFRAEEEYVLLFLFSPSVLLWFLEIDGIVFSSWCLFDVLVCSCFLFVTELGIYILYEDVKSCPCEDVQILWSILVESHPPPLRLKH